MALLLLTDSIYKTERTNVARTDALMDMQIHIGNAHTWLEEVLDGNILPEDKKGFAELDNAQKLLDAVAKSGPVEHGAISQALEQTEWIERTDRINSLLEDFRRQVKLRLTEPRERQSSEGSLEPHDEALDRLQAEARALEHIIEVTIAHERAQTRALFCGILVSWFFVVIMATITLHRLETRGRNAEAALLTSNARLHLQTRELEEHRRNLTQKVEARTRDLSATNERLQEELAERMRAEDALNKKSAEVRVLSARLLNAQELERKRIAMGIHDGLGQALNVIKLRVGRLGRAMTEGRSGLDEERTQLADYIDSAIDDVRRIALHLSPTVLEDLGLMSALLWLMNNFRATTGVEVSCEIAEIEELVKPEHRIVVYRIIQEALTNIGKHAQAKNVSLAIRRRGTAIDFSVEDDGKGFDPERILNGEYATRHFGLATMMERVNMIGGAFDLRSGNNEGTRVAFTLPVGEGGT